MQASKKYGVPSRTLYDKLKKRGILTANMQKLLQQEKQKLTNSETEAKKPSEAGQKDCVWKRIVGEIQKSQYS